MVDINQQMQSHLFVSDRLLMVVALLVAAQFQFDHKISCVTQLQVSNINKKSDRISICTDDSLAITGSVICILNKVHINCSYPHTVLTPIRASARTGARLNTGRG